MKVIFIFSFPTLLHDLGKGSVGQSSQMALFGYKLQPGFLMIAAVLARHHHMQAGILQQNLTKISSIFLFLLVKIMLPCRAIFPVSSLKGTIFGAEQYLIVVYLK